MSICPKCGFDNHQDGNKRKTFIRINKILYFYDQNIKNYIIWENYKKNFLINSKNFNLYDDFIMYPTFRDQNSINWDNARNAFEQSLVDCNINWFVYIKFYIDKDGKIKPLVVGRSGSMNVNCNGSDVSFSTDINHGPARRFLCENGLNWYKEQIAIKNCDSLKCSIDLEKEITIKYNLFNS